MELYNDIFSGNPLSLYQLQAILSTLIGCFGLYVTYRIRRPLIFRIKLAFAFLLPFIAGIFGCWFPIEKFHIIEVTLSMTFTWMITVLYWREVKEFMTTAGFHKRSLGNYIDDIPDLIWVKDIDYRYTYVNKAVCDVMGLNDKEILGKTDEDIGKLLTSRGIRYDFSQESGTIDFSHTHTLKARIFMQQGYIGDRYIALQVCKGPLYNSKFNNNRNHVGYIGIGRDLTPDVQAYHVMNELINSDMPNEALQYFKMHSSRYDKLK